MLKQWWGELTRSPLLAMTLSLILLLGAWQLINFWQFTRWQQTLLSKVAVVDVDVDVDKKLKKTKGNKKTTDILADKSPKALPNKIKPLSLVQINLPDLPTFAYLPKASSPVFSKEKAQHKKTIDSSTTQQTSYIQEMAIQTSTIEVTLNQKQNKKAPNTKRISAMYQQLTSNNSIDIEIAWPKNNIERQNTFSFLYQCLDMKFGVLNGQKTNTPKITLAKQPYTKSINGLGSNKGSNNSNKQVSNWLRIAQGQLAHQERNWLQQYDLSGTPVRLFPKAIDWQLAFLLTQQLNNVPLTSFRARYKYKNNHFMLTNIKLNGTLLANSWTLITSKCYLT